MKTFSIADRVQTPDGRTGVIQRFTEAGRALVYMDDNGAMLDFDPDKLQDAPVV